MICPINYLKDSIGNMVGMARIFEEHAVERELRRIKAVIESLDKEIDEKKREFKRRGFTL